jgi:hypothetical protein
MGKSVGVMLLLMVGLGAIAYAAGSGGNTVFEATATVDFGQDIGQNLGTVFEAYDAKAQRVYGAGFSGVYNTYGRMDRYKLQFYVRGAGAASPVYEQLPKPTQRSGVYLFDFAGRTCAWTYDQQSVLRTWDEKSHSWPEDKRLDRALVNAGDSPLTVGDGLLICGQNHALYKGQPILPAPTEGYYYSFYYANGFLCFFHTKRNPEGYTRVYACPWTPGDKAIELSRAQMLEAKYVGETPFAWGQLGRRVVTCSNNGGFYVFDGQAWTVLREADIKVSYQIYSMINYYDRLLMAQYPTGNLFEYDGHEIRQLKDWPPVMPGVGGSSREAQTTGFYGGDLYVGVWPWGELWRYSREVGKWDFVRRIFTDPPTTLQYGHPFEKDVQEYNQAHATNQIVSNGWGQRVAGLVAQGDSLLISTSSKGPEAREKRLPGLTDPIYAQYGQVLRMKLPGSLAATILPKSGPTELKFIVAADRMAILQDGQLLAETPLDPTLAGSLHPTSFAWGEGLFGPLAGHIKHRTTTPKLPRYKPE